MAAASGYRPGRWGCVIRSKTCCAAVGQRLGDLQTVFSLRIRTATGSLKAADIEALTPRQLQLLRADDINSLPCWERVSARVLNGLAKNAVSGLRAKVLNDHMSRVQLAALGVHVLNALSDTAIADLSGGVVCWMPRGTIAGLDARVLNGLSDRVLGFLDALMLNHLSSCAIGELDARVLNALRTRFWYRPLALDARVLNGLSSRAIGELDAHVLNRLPSSVFRALDARVLNGLSSRAIGELDARMLNRLPDSVFEALDARVLNGLPSRAIGELDAHVLNRLPSSVFRALDACVLNGLSSRAIGELDAHVLNRLPDSVFEALDARVMNGLCDNTLMAFDGPGLNHLSSRAIGELDARVLNRLPNRVFKALDARVLNGLCDNTLMAFDGPGLNHLSSHAIRALDARVLACLSSSGIGKSISHELRARIVEWENERAVIFAIRSCEQATQQAFIHPLRGTRGVSSVGTSDTVEAALRRLEGTLERADTILETAIALAPERLDAWSLKALDSLEEMRRRIGGLRVQVARELTPKPFTGPAFKL